MSRVLDEWLPRAATVIAAIFVLWVVFNNFVQGGIAWGDLSAIRLQTIISRATPITAVILLYSVIRLYYRRIRSGNRSLARKGYAYFAGFIFCGIIGLTFGSLSIPYTYTQFVLTRAVGEACASGWIAISFVSLCCRGWMVRTKEGAIMAFVGLFQLFAISGLGNFLLPQLADFGIWIMQYPAVGTNNAMWLTTYIALISIVGRLLTGKSKLRSTAR